MSKDEDVSFYYYCYYYAFIHSIFTIKHEIKKSEFNER